MLFKYNHASYFSKNTKQYFFGLKVKISFVRIHKFQLSSILILIRARFST